MGVTTVLASFQETCHYYVRFHSVVALVAIFNISWLAPVLDFNRGLGSPLCWSPSRKPAPKHL
uniref:Uncharacterized protein n=1 Tax=Arion vulgaris TaxID=1028688 RepID=A0A0B7BZD1_9EUPU